MGASGPALRRRRGLTQDSSVYSDVMQFGVGADVFGSRVLPGRRVRAARIRAGVLGRALVVISLVGCTGTSGRSAEPMSTQPAAIEVEVAPLQDTERTIFDGSVAFPIEFLEGVSSTDPNGMVIVSGSHRIDVDSDQMRRIEGLPPLDDQGFWAFPAGDKAVITAFCRGCSQPEVFVLQIDSTAAVRIGNGFASPAPDGVWLKSYLSESSCTLGKVAFDGSILRPAAPFDCDTSIYGQYGIGLVVGLADGTTQDAVLDPIDLSLVAEVSGFNSAVGSRVLTWDSHRFTLIDPQTGLSSDVESPTSIGSPASGKVSPDGTLVAVAFGHPAWPGPRQRLDVWILHLDTLAWTQMPSMPVAASLKSTSYQWLADGRFALFGDFDGVGPAVVIWQPEEAQLVVRSVDYPTSAGAVSWCTFMECLGNP